MSYFFVALRSCVLIHSCTLSFAVMCPRISESVDPRCSRASWCVGTFAAPRQSCVSSAQCIAGDRLPRAGGELMRFRVALSVCWFFCFYGVAHRLVRGRRSFESLLVRTQKLTRRRLRKAHGDALAMGTTVAARDEVFRDDEVHERRGADEAGEGQVRLPTRRGAALESRWWSFSLSATTVMLTLDDDDGSRPLAAHCATPVRMVSFGVPILVLVRHHPHPLPLPALLTFRLQ